MTLSDNIMIRILSRLIGLVITYFILRFMWWKGLLGIAIGMTFIIYLFVTNNMYLRMMVSYLGGNEHYTKEIFDNEKEKN